MAAPTVLAPQLDESPVDGTETRRAEWRWFAAALAVCWGVWGVGLLTDPRRWVLGDTQVAYFGWLYEFGTAVREGRWPILDPVTYGAGNHIVDGQMGLYSPLSLGLGLLATVVPNAWVFLTIVKFALCATAAGGGFALARSYGVRPPLAALVATATPLCGFTLIGDGTRWLAGQTVVALLPWAWWATRRAMAGRSPAPALVAGYLVVSAGYVYGTIFLLPVLGGLLLEALLARDLRALRRGLGVSVLLGLVAAAVYLPGVLTANATTRAHELHVPGPWDIGVHGFLTLNQPALGAPGVDVQAPFDYLFWFLPLFALVDWRAARRGWRGLVSLAVPVAFMTLYNLMPYELGPLRWPARVLDAYALVLALTLTVLLTRHRAAFSQTRLRVLVGWLAVGAVVRIVQGPDGWLWVLLATAAMGAALVWAVRRERIAVVALAGAALIGATQLLAYQGVDTARPHMPGDVSAYGDFYPGAEGVVVATHEVSDMRPDDPAAFYTRERARYVPIGSLTQVTGHLTGRPVVNSYSTSGFAPYTERFCARFTGDLCPGALARLLAVDPTTGERWVDLLGVRTLLVGRTPQTDKVAAPEGWREIDGNPYRRTWVRDDPTPPPGSVAWLPQGVTVEAQQRTPDSLTFTPTAVPAEGADVVINRIPWPGYRISGAEFTEPLDDLLMRVHLTPDQVGEPITITYRPPGWPLEAGSWLVAVVAGLGWSLAEVIRSRGSARSARGRARAGAAGEG